MKKIKILYQQVKNSSNPYNVFLLEYPNVVLYLIYISLQGRMSKHMYTFLSSKLLLLCSGTELDPIRYKILQVSLSFQIYAFHIMRCTAIRCVQCSGCSALIHTCIRYISYHPSWNPCSTCWWHDKRSPWLCPWLFSALYVTTKNREKNPTYTREKLSFICSFLISGFGEVK